MIRAFVLPVSLFGFLLVSHAGATGVRLEAIWSGDAASPPVALAIPPDGTNRHFIVQQRGVISVLPPGLKGEAKTFLDIRNRKIEENTFEEGLLGLAFHPKFKENGRFFIYYSQQDPKHSVISELKVSTADPNSADMASERVVMTVPQPFWNHNCGNLLFAPDGMLFIPLGDGGKGADPLRTSQNTFMPHGKILRIDVDGRTGSRPYGVPKDNPFVDKAKEGVLPEIWCSGMRNPWGVWIDRKTGLFWCADVGQDLFEEVNLIEKGGNYGWSWREGLGPFVQRKEPPPEGKKFIDPIVAYSRDKGISVTGGFVYYGKAMPSLVGAYLYGDWGSGRIWALRYDPATKQVTENNVIHEMPPGTPPADMIKPTAFCEDEIGEVLVLSWNGKIYRMREG
jgi:glucose/arabinose dehydrogenase